MSFVPLWLNGLLTASGAGAVFLEQPLIFERAELLTL